MAPWEVPSRRYDVTGGLTRLTGVDFGIYSTAPNPTSTGMVIGYAMPKAGLAKLDIYNLSGQRVRSLRGRQ